MSEKRANLPSLTDSEAICHLKEAIASGKPWHIALLEAIRLWTLPEETSRGQHRCFLIGGEAFDWLLLAERLCQEVNGLIPEDEMANLLLYGGFPSPVSEEEFKELVGSAKYAAYLNYHYGVVVEQSLLLAMEEEINKERQAHIFSRRGRDFEDSYQRIYGASQETLLRQFRREKGLPQRKSMSLSEMEEFTYWLFKYRLTHCDRARVASDTKKAVDFLRRTRAARQPLASPAPSSPRSFDRQRQRWPRTGVTAGPNHRGSTAFSDRQRQPRSQEWPGS